MTSETRRDIQRVMYRVRNIIWREELIEQEMPVVRVYADPNLTNLALVQPFQNHKTTIRDHYQAARSRVTAQGANEVLLFCPSSTRMGMGRFKFRHQNKESDILIEGSYANVAVLDSSQLRWKAPPITNCLPGIQRHILLERAQVDVGEITRGSLRPGIRVRLFISVRGALMA